VTVSDPGGGSAQHDFSVSVGASFP
jgi:hypothetical protein